jgi:hypothetical protein
VVQVALGVQVMISTTAYILIIAVTTHGELTQSTIDFADKASCESAAVKQDFAFKNLQFAGRWNLTCHPYQLTGEKK